MAFGCTQRAACAIAYCLVLALVPVSLAAQDLEPRSYTNLPMGQNFLAVGYAYSDGEINPSPSVPLRDIEITMKATVAAYVRSLDLWGKAGKVDALWGRVCQEGSGFVNEVLIRGDRCGTLDPSVRLSYLFYGAPAVDLKTFMSTPQHRVIGVSLQVNMPLGDYNNENIINTGSNRWTFKPEIGISNRWGAWSGEAAFAARFFTENDNYKGNTTLEQDPLYQLQAHLVYDLPRGLWVAIDGNYFWGGRTEREGVRGDDRQENSRIGATFALPLTAQQSLKFYASRGLVSNIGNDSDTFGVVWQYRWSD